MSTTTTVLCALLLSACTSAPLQAQTKPPPAPAPTTEAKPEDKDKAKDEAKPDESKPDEEPALAVTSHSVTAGGHTLSYHATAGYLVLKTEGSKTDKDDKPKAADKLLKDDVTPKARVFFVAYTLDDVKDPAARPVTFCFNGGPGSSAVWLHMGGMAPRRTQLTEEGEAPPPPWKLVDSESTWLDDTDLVFIDPVSTGYSRPLPEEDAKQFHGLREDVASVGEFIRLYTTRNERWLSPKFVVGESYGTTRAAGLSDYLQDRHGLYLNGIVLVSSAMNFQTISFSPQNDVPYVGFLPGYTATAWYHKKLPQDLQSQSLEQVCALSRAFAGGPYRQALGQGDRIAPADAQRVAGDLARFTGLSADFCLQRNLRVSDGLFFGQLLRDQGKVVGRLDARFTGLRYEPGTDGSEYDPSDEAVGGPFTATFNDYVRRELDFHSDLPYETLANVYPWNFGDAGDGYPDTLEALRRAMTRNPYLKVWVTCSYYDLATPFFAAEDAVASMNLDPAVRGNLRFTYYESGHMLYIHAPSRAKFKTDFESFLKDATAQPVVPAAAR
jgi:carboxypeptidase C (cathepsin A)